MKQIILFLLFSFIDAQPGSISGIIMGESTPLQGVNVMLEGTVIGTSTNAEGFYMIEGLEPGKYTLIVDYIGFRSQYEDFYITSEKMTADDDSGSDEYLEKIGIGKIVDQIPDDILKDKFHEDVDFNLDLDPVGIDEITVSAAKSRRKITKAPSIALNINEKRIRRKAGVFNYNRLVSGLKGVDVMFYGAEGAQLNTRGLASSYSQRFKQYYDGIDLADVIYGTVNSMTFSPPREAISKIEVLYGPQSTLYGPDATNGLSNIIPRDPRYDSSSEINLSINSNSMKRVGGRYAKSMENYAFDILFESMESPEYNYGNTDTNAAGEYINPIWFNYMDENANYVSLSTNKDIYGNMDQKRNLIEGNLYFNLLGGDVKMKSLYSIGDGYVMASTNPTYHKESIVFLQDFKFRKDNYFFRSTYRNQSYYWADMNQIASNMAFHKYVNDSTFTTDDYFDKMKDEVDKSFYKTLFLDYQFNHKFYNDTKLLVGADARIVNHNYKMRDTGNSFDEYNVRNGIFTQITKNINTDLELTSSARIDYNEIYGLLFSPRLALVYDMGNNSSVKFISGKSFKAPNIFDQNSYNLNENYFIDVLHPYQYPFYPVSMFVGSMDEIEALLGDELIIENQIWPEEYGPYDATMWPEEYGDYPFGESNWNSGEVIMNPSYDPYHGYFSMDVLNTGNHSGFTIHDYLDNNQNFIFDEGDSLISTEKISSLKPEILTQSEIGFTKLVNKNLMLDLNGYVGKYTNYKSVSQPIGQSGEYWVKTYAMDDDSAAFIEALYRYPTRRIDVVNNYDDYTPSKNTNIWSYRNLDVSAYIWGFEGQLKYMQDIGELLLNFSYFNDDDLVNNRNKAVEYSNCINEYGEGTEACIINESYKDFLNLYSNTTHFKYSVSGTAFSLFGVDGFDVNFQLKGNTPYDFVSGGFRATKEKDVNLSSHTFNSNYFEDKGQIGGGITLDINIAYQFENYNMNMGINNITESQTFTFPLSPELPRTFVLELGYKF